MRSRKFPSTKNHKNHVTRLLVIFGVSLCVITDSSINPLGGSLRLAPLILLPILMIFNIDHINQKRDNSLHKIILFLIIPAGILSSILSDVPLLGLIKLGIFCMIIIPLSRSLAIQEAFLPNTTAFKVFERLLDFLLVVLILQSFGAFKFLDNSNKVGALAMVILPWKLYNIRNLNEARRIANLLNISVIFFIIIASHSRGALIGSLVMLIVFFSSGSNRSIFRPVIFGSCLFLGAFFLIGSVPELRDYMYKGGDQLLDQKRLMMMEDSIAKFAEQPLLGYGFGLSWNVLEEHTGEVLRTGRLSGFVGEFGNSTFAILAGGGAILLAAFGIYFSGLIYQIDRSFSGSCSFGKKLLLQRAMLAGVLGMLAHSQIEGWILSPLNWISIFFWIHVGIAQQLAAGALLGRRRYRRLSETKRNRYRRKVSSKPYKI